MGKFTIREIKPEDNAGLERVIRSCLIEIGQNHDGTIWTDPMLGKLSEEYHLQNGFVPLIHIQVRLLREFGFGVFSNKNCAATADISLMIKSILHQDRKHVLAYEIVAVYESNILSACTFDSGIPRR